jgi:anaerobic ribonucleoside-triphosphate reductase
MKPCWRCQFDMDEEGYILRCPNCDWTETRDFSSEIDSEHYRALRDTATFIAEKCAELAQELPDEHALLMELYQKAQNMAENWDDKANEND